MDAKEKLESFGRMWYLVFLWCLAGSVLIHCIAACVAFGALRKHSRGRFFPLLIIFIGFLYPITGGIITISIFVDSLCIPRPNTYVLCAVIAAVYRTANFAMPVYVAFLWGAGQSFIGFLISYSRILATL